MQCLHKTLLTTPVEYFLCTSEQQTNKLLKDKQANSILPSLVSGAMTVLIEESRNDPDFIIVCVYEKYVRGQIMTLMIHEAVHVWQYIRASLINGSIEANNDSLWEVEAYAIDHIATNLINECEKRHDFDKDN